MPREHRPQPRAIAGAAGAKALSWSKMAWSLLRSYCEVVSKNTAAAVAVSACLSFAFFPLLAWPLQRLVHPPGSLWGAATTDVWGCFCPIFCILFASLISATVEKLWARQEALRGHLTAEASELLALTHLLDEADRNDQAAEVAAEVRANVVSGWSSLFADVEGRGGSVDGRSDWDWIDEGQHGAVERGGGWDWTEANYEAEYTQHVSVVDAPPPFAVRRWADVTRGGGHGGHGGHGEAHKADEAHEMDESDAAGEGGGASLRKEDLRRVAEYEASHNPVPEPEPEPEP